VDTLRVFGNAVTHERRALVDALPFDGGLNIAALNLRGMLATRSMPSHSALNRQKLAPPFPIVLHRRKARTSLSD
jgi:hypothetical protein